MCAADLQTFKTESMKRISAILFMLSLGVLGGAQPLDSLLDMLRAGNPELRALDQSYRADELVADQVDDWADTEFGAGFGLLPTETRLGPQRFKLSVTQMLPWPGRLDAKRNLAEAKASVSQWDAPSRTLQLERRFTEAYYRLYELRKTDGIIAGQLVIVEQVRRLLLQRVAAGQARTTDLLRLDLREEELREQRQSLVVLQQIPLSVMQELLGTDRPVFTPDTLLVALFPEGVQMDSTHPEILRLEQQLRVAESEIAVAELQRKPSLGVGLDYFLVGARNDAAPAGNGRDIVLPRVMLSVPLGGDRYDKRQEEQRVRMAAIADRERGFVLALRQKQTEARARYEEALLALDSYARQQAVLSETIELEIRALSIGETRLEDVLELYNREIDFQIKELRAIVATHLALADLMSTLP